MKGWVGEEGVFETRVFDVVGEPVSEALLDTRTCEVVPAGRDSLCQVWEDPTFEAEVPAVYYARVLEAPSCRWSTRLCERTPAAERPGFCEDATVPKAIRERAWTSPVWVRPQS